METQESIYQWSEQAFPCRTDPASGIRAQGLKLVAEAVELALACGATPSEVNNVAHCRPRGSDDMQGWTERRTDPGAIGAELADVRIVSAVLEGRISEVLVAAGISWVDLQSEIDRKMAANRGRVWAATLDGAAQHVVEGDES